ASSICQKQKFFVHSAQCPITRIRKGPVPMNECVPRITFTVPTRKTSMTHQEVSKLLKHTAGVLGSIFVSEAMMQMDFYLTPSAMTVCRKLIDKIWFILFGRIEVCMPQWQAVGVAPFTDGLWIFLTPTCKSTFLLSEWRK